MTGSSTFCISFNPFHFHFVVSCSRTRGERIVHEVRSRAHVRSRAGTRAQIGKSARAPSDRRGSAPYHALLRRPTAHFSGSPPRSAFAHRRWPLASAPALGLSADGPPPAMHFRHRICTISPLLPFGFAQSLTTPLKLHAVPRAFPPLLSPMLLFVALSGIRYKSVMMRFSIPPGE